MKSLLSCVAIFVSLTLSIAHADTALETSMKKMADAAHQLAADLKQTDDTKHAKDIDLQSVATIKDASTKAHDEVPKKAKALPADQQQTMTASYQKDMETFAKDVDALGQDIQTDNWPAARTDFAKVMDDEKNGHKAYRVKKN